MSQHSESEEMLFVSSTESPDKTQKRKSSWDKIPSVPGVSTYIEDRTQTSKETWAARSPWYTLLCPNSSLGWKPGQGCNFSVVHVSLSFIEIFRINLVTIMTPPVKWSFVSSQFIDLELFLITQFGLSVRSKAIKHTSQIEAKQSDRDPSVFAHLRILIMDWPRVFTLLGTPFLQSSLVVASYDCDFQ